MNSLPVAVQKVSVVAPESTIRTVDEETDQLAGTEMLLFVHDPLIVQVPAPVNRTAPPAAIVTFPEVVAMLASRFRTPLAPIESVD